MESVGASARWDDDAMKDARRAIPVGRYGAITVTEFVTLRRDAFATPSILKHFSTPRSTLR